MCRRKPRRLHPMCLRPRRHRVRWLTPAALPSLRPALIAIPSVVPGKEHTTRIAYNAAMQPVEVTEEGFRGGPVMPDDFDGSQKALDQLRYNVNRAGLIGSLVSNDQKSSVVFVPLLALNAETGKPLDYAALSKALEDKIRSKQSDKIHIQIIGFAKLIGAGHWLHAEKPREFEETVRVFLG